MIEKIKATIKKYNMLCPTDYTAVAFSGGADSTALLDILYKMGYKVCAIHINHMIRAEEADRDEEFCRQLCNERAIPFFCHRIDVPALAKQRGESLELAARSLRYAAIEATAAENGITRVATAHHADDNAETLLFNITRGSGAKGGCGIPPVRGIYIRPLIECTKDEITEYCKKTELDFVTDSTNLSNDYTRNFIRNEITPRLKEINPRMTEALTLFCGHLRKDEELLQSLVPQKATRKELACLPDPLLSRYIQKHCDANSTAVTALMNAIRKGNEYLRVDMGKGLEAVCDRNSLIFRKKITQPTHKGGIMGEGDFNFGEFGEFCITNDPKKATALQEKNHFTAYTYLKGDKLKGNIYVRGRADGDKYRYNGMTHSLKKLFNSRKIPVERRSTVPLVCDDSGIIWIPGFLPREDIKADNKYKEIIFIGYKRCKDES